VILAVNSLGFQRFQYGPESSRHVANGSCSTIVANALVIYAYAGVRRGAEVPRYLARNWKRLFIGAVLTTGSYGVALWAMTRAPVASVAALRETSVLFAALLGTVLLKERFGLQRALGTGVIVAGVMALRFA